MRKILLTASLLTLPLFGFSQILQEDFDGNGPGISAWTTIDQDGLTPDSDVDFITSGWNRIDRAGADGNFGGPAGNFAAVSTSYYDPAGTSNDWLISPTIAISGTSPTLYWDAKAQDNSYRDGYKVMLSPNGGSTIADFTVQIYSTVAESASWTSRAADLTPYIGQNVRVAFVNNSNDKFLLLIDNIKVDYTYVAPPITYCGPLVFEDFFGENVEPITLVNFAGINNTTSATLDGDSHEFFLSQIANVTTSQSYDITLKGNTGGNWENSFAVFIDWNQNGILNDAGEVYEITQTITNSTGTDGIQAVHSIAVPANAALGNTRMRVKKIYGTLADAPDLIDPCVGSDYGQAEDYTVNVTNTLATTEINHKKKVGIYPNPVIDILTIESADKILKFEVYDTTGKVVISEATNTNKIETNVSRLTTGNYLLKITTTGGITTQKLLKK